MKGKLDKLKWDMLDYFANYSSADGAPSFAKFRRAKGISYSEFEKIKVKRGFRDVLNECSEFRRDYLIDCGLTKRFDASFVKFLLQIEDESGENEDSIPQICFEVADEKI